MRPRDLRLSWDKALGVASLFLTADGPGGRCVDAREVGDVLVLHYDQEGRCAEAEFLDPDAFLPQDASPEVALRVAFDILASPGGPGFAG